MGRLAKTYLPVKTWHIRNQGPSSGLLDATSSLEEQAGDADEDFDVVEEVDSLLDGLLSSLADSVS